MASSFKMVLFQHHPDQSNSGTTNLQQSTVIAPMVGHPALETACMSRLVLHISPRTHIMLVGIAQLVLYRCSQYVFGAGHTENGKLRGLHSVTQSTGGV